MFIRLKNRKRPGAYVKNKKTTFRLFSPSAEQVQLVIFKSFTDPAGVKFPMKKDMEGMWEITFNEELFNCIYGYKLANEYSSFKIEDAPLCLDPYAKAVASFTDFLGERRGILMENDFDWGNDMNVKIDVNDLIIYEMHIKDATSHYSSQAFDKGSYAGLIEENIIGGLEYIKKLGVNAVEFLPCMEFANIEIPFFKKLNTFWNTWNPYERNHWGYMTVNYFSPSALYSEPNGELEWRKWIGANCKQVDDFKTVIKKFHENNIAVIMDVVFNHISEYESGNLKQIEKQDYFRLDAERQFLSQSFCGNDLKTESPRTRELIVNSILYWMTEYHIDGFRFDLCNLIDQETLEIINHEAKLINPDVILIAEPWGGSYNPKRFTELGWSSWNDQFRNGIKGENPFLNLGWIFGNWFRNDNLDSIKSFLRGTLAIDDTGLFNKASHSVNYLESHDGYTLGDFIRLATTPQLSKKVICDATQFVLLNKKQLKLSKLAALALFVSRGIIMIHAGQEFARAKIVCCKSNVKDPNKGKIDHNSYEKDNETNYINYEHANVNHELFNYYKGLIALRKKFKAFRRADYNNYEFHEVIFSDFTFAFKLTFEDEVFFVALNSDPNITATFTLPDKNNWEVYADDFEAKDMPINVVRNEIYLPPTCGIICKQVLRVVK